MALASLAVMVPFCRWLCPLAAVLNLFSRFGLTRIKRNTDNCSNCGHCTKSCPMAIPVHEVEEVRHARCTACMECVGACPRIGRGALEVRTRAPRAVVVGGLILLLAAPVAASWLLPLPSFRWSRGEEPATTASVELGIDGLTCRGSANLLVYFLTRDDLLELPGYLGLEAWPGPGAARARITYDPAFVDEDAVRSALTEPYFEPDWQAWRHAPFRIEGHDPFTER